MPNLEELFTRRFGGGKRTYYLDVKRDSKGDRYIVISESTRKEGDRKMRSRVMVWKEDFHDLFDCLREMEEYLMREEPDYMDEAEYNDRDGVLRVAEDED